MAGGDEAAFALAEPVMAAYAKAITPHRRARLGPALQDGQPDLPSPASSRAWPRRPISPAAPGSTPSAVYEAISKGAAQSWQMDNRWKTMAEGKFDFGFAVDWMRKDLGLVLDEARANGARLEVTALVDQFYAEVQAMGGRRWDTSSLAARLERDDGLASRRQRSTASRGGG